jgi:uncharacterized membrane protein
MTKIMKLNRVIALVGSIITLVQALLIAYDKESICFNNGCAVVDSLTTVDPIFINLGGFFFFQIVFWGIWFARKKHERMKYVKVILLAGIAVEGVLVSFQYFVAQVFCSYCLLILAIIVLLNLFAGLRHFIASSILFLAVVTGFASLQFAGVNNQTIGDIDNGTFATLRGSEVEKRYLFFSSTCKYCEEVIVSLKDGSECGIRFNPIDEILDFPLPNADLRGLYEPTVNRTIMQSLGLEQVPVMLILRDSGFEVIKGAGAIESYLDEECKVSTSQFLPGGVIGTSENSGFETIIPQDESCKVAEDCEDPEIPPVQKDGSTK